MFKYLLIIILQIMPIDPSVLVSGVAGIGQGLQGFITGKQNKDQREWNEKMYGLQRADALSDWNRQNQYNSPEEQMRRLKAAGLNPNLVYGQGTNAANAGSVRSSTVEAYNPKSINVDLGQIGQAIGSYQDMKLKQAQTNNLEAQNAVIAQDAALRAAQVVATKATGQKTTVDTQKTEFDLQQAQRLADTSVQTAEATLRKINADIDYTLDNNERQQAITSNTLQQGAEAILTARSNRQTSVSQRAQIAAQIENIRRDTTLKDLDIQLRKMGIFPSDPMWSRVLGRIVGDPQKLAEKLKENIVAPPTDSQRFWKKGGEADKIKEYHNRKNKNK